MMITKRENIPGVNNGFGVESDADYVFHLVDKAEAPLSKRNKKVIVCKASEIGSGEKKIFQINQLSIGVFNIKGKFYALKNNCPHAGAPLCEGHIQTTHRPGKVGEFHPDYEGRILRCPWHGFEFDIITGKGLYDRTSRVATYQTEVDGEGNIVVTV